MPRGKIISKDKIDVDKAFEVHSRIVERELARRALLADNVKDLTWMFDTQHYKGILGFDPPPQWTGYLGMVELYYSRAEVERWRKIYHYFDSIDTSLDTVFDIPPTRLEDIAKIAPDVIKLNLLLSQARQLGSLEWKNALAEFQGKPTSDECDHKMRIEERCTKCGMVHPVQIPKE